MASKRLMKELEAYHRDPSPALVSLEPVEEDKLDAFRAILRGPEGTAYAGGEFALLINIPDSYPAQPPSIRFETPCCHPNVNFTTGEICLDLLKTSWTPAYGLVSTLEAVQQLMSAGGEPDSPLNIDLAKLMRVGDLIGAEGLVRFMTGVYAIK